MSFDCIVNNKTGMTLFSGSVGFTVLMLSMVVMPGIQANADELDKRTEFVYIIPEIKMDIANLHSDVDQLNEKSDRNYRILCQLAEGNC